MNDIEFKQFLDRKITTTLKALADPKADRFELNEQLFNYCRDERREFTHVQRVQIRQTIFDYCNNFVMADVANKAGDKDDAARERYLVTLASCFLNGWGTKVDIDMAYTLLCVFEKRDTLTTHPYEFTFFWWQVFQGVFDNKYNVSPKSLNDMARREINAAGYAQKGKFTLALILLASQMVSANFEFDAEFRKPFIKQKSACLKSSCDEALLTYAYALIYRLPLNTAKEKRQRLQKLEKGVKRALEKHGTPKADTILAREYSISFNDIWSDKQVRERRAAVYPHLYRGLAAGYGRSLITARLLFIRNDSAGLEELKKAIAGLELATHCLRRYRNMNGDTVRNTYHTIDSQLGKDTTVSWVNTWAGCLRQIPEEYERSERLEMLFVYLLTAVSRLYDPNNNGAHLASQILNGLCQVDPEMTALRNQLLAKQVTNTTLEGIVAELANVELASAPPLLPEETSECTSSSPSSSSETHRFFSPEKPSKANKPLILPPGSAPSAPAFAAESKN